MGIFTDEQGAFCAELLAEVADSLGNSRDVVGRKAAVSSLSAMARRAKAHLLMRIAYVRMSIGIGRRNSLQINIILFSYFRSC